MIRSVEWGIDSGPTPLFSIVTRCHPDRPSLLEINRVSVASQTNQDYERILLWDDQPSGSGLHEANRFLAQAHPLGRYVLILDDDDAFGRPDALERIAAAVSENDDPDLLFFKAYHGPLGILPRDNVWENRPILGSVGSCDFVSRLDVWLEHIHAFGVASCGDYAFLSAVWDRPCLRVGWHDEALINIQQIGNGAGE